MGDVCGALYNGFDDDYRCSLPPGHLGQHCHSHYWDGDARWDSFCDAWAVIGQQFAGDIATAKRLLRLASQVA